MRYYVLTLFSLFSLNIFAQGSLEGDRLALVALYNSSGGDYWYNAGMSAWPVSSTIPGDSPCGWYGITCSGGRVTKISLPENDMYGSIPPEIGNLTALTYLDFSGPGREFGNLTGSVPAEIGALSNLEHLNLSGNDFNGDNVEAIGNMIKLKYLAITPDWNIPDEFGDLINLEYLNLSVVDQSGLGPDGKAGDIPASFGNLTKLKTFIMIEAGATGSIPVELGNLINLETLNFRRNQLVGSIPSQLKNLTALTTLNLSDNKLSGSIPSLTGIPLSASVNISNNQFTFDGLETNVNIIDTYAPQSWIPLTVYPAFPLPYIITVNAGGIENNYQDNNTYKYFQDGVLIATQVGDPNRFIMGGGRFRIEVTNSIATKLTLYTQEVYIERGAMPVTLISFEATNESNNNILTWQTTSETNNSGFDIERSADAKTFEKIGFVDGKGDSKGLQTYNFTDLARLNSTYYRLKQIDYDGKFEYSRIISVKRDHAGFSVYPNPAKSLIFLNGIDKKEQITVRNLEGNIMLQESVFPKQPVNINNLSDGLYLVTVGNDTKKIVIQN